MDNTIGKNLRAAREFLGLTQLQVADILHMTEYVVNDYETGALIPDSQTIILFSKLYGISCWDILCTLMNELPQSYINYYKTLKINN